MKVLNQNLKTEEAFELINKGDYSKSDLYQFIKLKTDNKLSRLQMLKEDLDVYVDVNCWQNVNKAFKESFKDEEEYQRAITQVINKGTAEAKKFGITSTHEGWGFITNEMAKINNSSFQVFNLEKLYFLINELIHQKSEQQNDRSPTYDLSFLLPFIVSGDDDPEDWSEDKVQKFEETVKKAGEEISADDIPKNSPAGEYRSKIYNEVKEGLQETVRVYKSKQGENSQRVWAICDFILFSLGWDDSESPYDRLEDNLKTKIDAIANSIHNDGRSRYQSEEVRMYLSVYKINIELISTEERKKYTMKFISNDAKERLKSAKANTLSTSWQNRLNKA